MNYKMLLRISVFTVLFFAVGHSVGHFTRKSTDVPELLGFFKMMEEIKFPIGTQMRSYDEFYEGMSLNLIITLFGIAPLLWILSGMESSDSRKILLPILFIMIGFTITGFLYFFIVPAVTCAVTSVLILGAILSKKKS